MVQQPRILVVGFGNMGQALVAGWLARDHLPESISIIDPGTGARTAALALGLRVVNFDSVDYARTDVVLLAVKPTELESVLASLREATSRIDAGRGKVRLYLSIAAGKTLASVARQLGSDAAIVRAMPNTPAAIGHGVTGLCANQVATDAQRTLALDLMGAVGHVEWLDDEAQMDALTAVSGSGPAYVFLLIEYLAAAAENAGLDPFLAARLAKATVAGAGLYAGRSELTARELKRRVTSPSGTTEAALEVLEAGDVFSALLRDAVAAATRRSRELSD